ncbi:MAG: NAD-glutamate dehydrogenase [Candidatus Phosphoribacter sp.]
MSSSLEQSRAHVLRAAADLAQMDSAAPIEHLLVRYYRHVATEDLLARAPEDLLGAALSHRDVARQRPWGTSNVTVDNPTVEVQGWASQHTAIQIVTDDMPFLVDSVTMALTRGRHGIHLVVHPQLVVQRDAVGDLQDVLDSDKAPHGEFGVAPESWMHLEIDRMSDAGERAALTDELRRVLGDVRDAVEDWPKMRDRCQVLADELRRAGPAGIPVEETDQGVRFLDWLAANHFTFLGYRQYVLGERDGETVLHPVTGSGLGLLRYDSAGSAAFARLSPPAQQRARDAELLIITKANSRATVHRPVYLDYIGVKTFDAAGVVTGEHRFLGLFAAAAYTASILEIPILGDRASAVLDSVGYTTDSHSGKDLLQVLESYPRDELFQTNAATLTSIAETVVHLHERIRTKLFLRKDTYGRFMSALVFLPRDRYNTAVRLRVEGILRKAFDAESVDFTTRVSESPLAQVHFVLRVPKGAQIPDVDAEALEEEIVEATRTWDEDLLEAARTEHGEELGVRLAGLYGKAFPEAYKEDFTPRVAIADMRRIESLSSADDVALTMYAEPGGPREDRRFKLYTRTPLTLTRVLPVFTHMGVEVTDERPYILRRGDGTRVHVYDFGLRARSAVWWGEGTDREPCRQRFQDAFGAVWRGGAESDGFNALVLRAELDWRQVVVLRALAKYLRQTQATFSQDYVEAALVANAGIARDLVDLFETRFDPTRFAGVAGPERAVAEDEIVERITDALVKVTSLDHDRIVRALLAIVRAATRTNHYQLDAEGQHHGYLAMKLDPKALPDLPAPRPMFEIWVYSPRVEGVHLRFGKVARGGLRWSDRREDFRTEVLGLVKAQMVKNAVIVPTGSKGCFYPKALPDPVVDRDGWLAEGIASYRIFISGLLDVTDNRSSGTLVPPVDVVRHDPDDSYLVVAADKGTASFSDIANAVSQDYGFWLDDAFASGGSAGFDHKGMGITAKGAWESVKRHFREMGSDTQTEDFTCVGVGDMSGDVFGNGMLLSEHIRLIAAFDHRHLFLDPNPDAARSYTERQRLFKLPRSSWADYDRSLISAGGGVFDRSAKSIPITPQMAAVLTIDPSVTAMTPAELMRAVLLAKVDLLWNGGIGTYVKAASEGNAEVGDRANDAIRVNGRQLRCKVVGEGGNLGFTQLGRIEAARTGVRVNTDALDNSAGVDTSDHEVNIKILLGALVRDGDMTIKQRNALLASMTDEVAAQVLRDNYEQNVLLGNARAQELTMLPVHQRLIHHLEQNADLDRSLEYLPGDAEIVGRQADGRGLTSPEFSVLVAYSKLDLKAALLPTSLPDDPWFRRTLAEYFPSRIRAEHDEQLDRHPLKREIIVNSVVNSLVNGGGITFAFRAKEETNASAEQIARAFVVCREVFGLADYVAAVEALDSTVPTMTQTVLFLEFRRLLDRAIRWFLTARPGTIDIAAEIERFQGPVRQFAAVVPDVLQGSERRRLDRAAADLVATQVPEALALRTASLLDVFSMLDIVEIAHATGVPTDDVLRVYYHASERFGIDDMLYRVSQLSREDRWDALARGALRDDLYAVLDGITRAVLSASDPALDAKSRFNQWAKANSEALDRARSGLQAILRLDTPNIAALSVALRTLRAFVRTTAAEG